MLILAVLIIGAFALTACDNFIVPTVPQDFKATAGNAQVVLTWTAPANDGGTPILKYEASSGATWIDASSSTTHTFTNLDNDTEYTFRVRAVNAI